MTKIDKMIYFNEYKRRAALKAIGSFINRLDDKSLAEHDVVELEYAKECLEECDKALATLKSIKSETRGLNGKKRLQVSTRSKNVEAKRCVL